MTLRLAFLDRAWLEDMLETVTSSIQREHDAHEAGTMSQRSLALHLAEGYLDCARFKFALGAPFGEVRDALRLAAENHLEALRIRDTEREAFPPDGDREDHSLTVSNRTLLYTWSALAAGEDKLARDIAIRIWDPESAYYIGTKSEVCTPAEQQFAYAARNYYRSDLNETRAHLSHVRTLDERLRQQRWAFPALLDRNADKFLESIVQAATKFSALASKRSNHQNSQLFLNLPDLGLAALAVRSGLVNPSTLPHDLPQFAVQLTMLPGSDVAPR